MPGRCPRRRGCGGGHQCVGATSGGEPQRARREKAMRRVWGAWPSGTPGSHIGDAGRPPSGGRSCDRCTSGSARPREAAGRHLHASSIGATHTFVE